MQLQQLIYFVCVAESGSINKAAEKLFVSQPNLSKAIINLENELAIRILDRNTRGVSLTEDGKTLYQYARTMLDQMELIERIGAREAPRLLSIASYPIITMSRLVSDFYNQCDNKDISFKLMEHRLQKVVEFVENGEAEIGFIMNNQVQTKELRHTLNFKGLEMNVIGTDTWYVNVGKRNPLYEKEEVTMQELLLHPFVRMPDDYFSKLTFYLEIDGVSLKRFQRVIYVNDSAAITTVLHNTDAIRFGPGLSKPDFEKYGIRTIPIRNCDVQINVAWIRRKKELLSEHAENFVEVLNKLYK